MNAKTAILTALKRADSSAAALADMKDAPLQRSNDGGNHAMWIAGHLAVIEGRLHKMIFGTGNPAENWKPLFDWGSTPSGDASIYPPFEQVLAALADLRGKTRAYVESVEDQNLDAPLKSMIPGIPFDSIGNAILIIAFHQCVHCGEATAIRRAAGKMPFFTPSPDQRAF